MIFLSVFKYATAPEYFVETFSINIFVEMLSLDHSLLRAKYLTSVCNRIVVVCTVGVYFAFLCLPFCVFTD